MRYPSANTLDLFKNSVLANYMESPTHVLFFTTRLGGGGAEKLLLRILQNLNRRQFRISLALCKAGGSYETSLPEDIPVYHLVSKDIPSVSLPLILSVLPLRRLIEKIQPDVLCASMDNANTVAVLATRQLNPRPKLVLSVHNPPSWKYTQPPRRLLNQIIFALMPITYPYANGIINVSQGVAEDLANIAPKAKHLLQVIYNPCVDEELLKGAQEIPPETIPPEGRLIVACGRLHPQKGFADLIEAIVEVRKIIPAYLWIIGEGELRQELENQIDSLGLRDCVRLLGFKANPYQYMAKADLFVLSSVFEGFGNVIVEAMACGTPVVATDCPTGPREIITPGVNGLLVPPNNQKELATAILRVLTDSQLQQELAQQGKKRSEDFSATKIAKMYGDLFLAALK